MSRRSLPSSLYLLNPEQLLFYLSWVKQPEVHKDRTAELGSGSSHLAPWKEE